MTDPSQGDDSATGPATGRPAGGRPRRGSLVGSAAVVAAATMVSRVLGFIRDVVLAQVFGASAAADAFFVAFRLPNLLRRVFAEGAFAQAFVPVLGRVRAEAGDAERAAAREFLAYVTGALSLALGVVTAVGVIAAPWLVALIAPGFSAETGQAELTAAMLRITFPYLAFISLTACAAGVLNTYGQFAVPALTPTLLNICLIAAALWWAPAFEQPIMALSWGVFIAGAAQLAVQLPSLARLALLVRPRVDLRHPGVRKVWTLVLPGIFGASVAQLNLVVNTIIASYLVAGSISWLYYSDRLAELPLGVIGVALGTVILPRLSSQHSRGEDAAFSATLAWALRVGAWLSVPAALALGLLAAPILSTLFQHGAFGADDVLQARRSLLAYAAALPAWVAIKALAPGYFSRQDVRTPVRFAVVALLVNLVTALALFRPLGHVGLALAIALSAWVNAGLLLVGLLRGGHWRPGSGWGGFALRLAVSCALMLGVVSWLAPATDAWWLAAAAQERMLQLAITVLAGGAVFCAAAWILGARSDLQPVARGPGSGGAPGRIAKRKCKSAND